MSATASSAGESDGFGSKTYRGYVLAMLFAVFSFEVIDRILFSLVQESIKADLRISDFQLGLLGGPAFVILNSLAALPIAYLADRSNRVTIVSAGLTLWSFATAACGYATSFLQLVGLRGLVGIGGAACLPPSHSLIADYFPARMRGSALAVFGLAIPVGSMIAAIGGGWIAAKYGWQWAFVFFGVPGLLTGLLVKLTVKEPPRGEQQAFDHPLASFKELAAKPAFRHLTLGAAVLGLFTFSINQFLVSFMVRNYGIAMDVAAFYFGLVIVSAMGGGIFAGGFLADRLSPKDRRAFAWIPMIGILISGPLFLLGFSQDELIPMVVLVSLASLFCYLYISPSFAAVQSIAGAKRRASAPALFLTVSTLIGYGLGPPIVGLLADRGRDEYLKSTQLTPQQCEAFPQTTECLAAGGYGLKIGLMIMVAVFAWSAFHYWMAGRSMRQDAIN
jgi:MFS family permease